MPKAVFNIGVHEALDALCDLTASPDWQGGDEAICDALLRDTLEGWWAGTPEDFEPWWAGFDTSDLTHAQMGSELHVALIAHCWREDGGEVTEAFVTDATPHGVGNVTFGGAPDAS